LLFRNRWLLPDPSYGPGGRLLAFADTLAFAAFGANRLIAVGATGRKARLAARDIVSFFRLVNVVVRTS
jgi:hypothetical protein